jgi:hypothetical protein
MQEAGGSGCSEGGTRSRLANILHASTGRLCCKAILPVGSHSNEMRQRMRRDKSATKCQVNVRPVPRFPSRRFRAAYKP